MGGQRGAAWPSFCLGPGCVLRTNEQIYYLETQVLSENVVSHWVFKETQQAVELPWYEASTVCLDLTFEVADEYWCHFGSNLFHSTADIHWIITVWKNIMRKCGRPNQLCIMWEVKGYYDAFWVSTVLNHRICDLLSVISSKALWMLLN